MRAEQFDSFEENSESKKNREAQREINKLCYKIYRTILDDYEYKGKYYLSKKVWDDIEIVKSNLEIISGQATDQQALILVLNFLNQELGALPEELGNLYTETAFSPQEIRRQLDEEKDIHQAFKKVSDEIKKNHINLDIKQVRGQMKLTEQELHLELQAELEINH